MRKHLLQLICLAIISTAIYSCKLDPAILPGQPGYVYVAPPTTGGGTGTGTGTGAGTISPYDDAALTSTWKVTTTTIIEYVDGAAQSSPSPINLFVDAQLDDAAKTAIFDGSFVVDGTQTYVVSKTSSGALYIQLSADPFERSSNGPIQIQSLTATTMTWLAVDPLIITTQGHKLQSAWQMTFTKE
jgi:hypothetical protein